MSKSTAAMARLIADSNIQLYDRYINFRLSKAEFPYVGPDDFEIKTPLTGIKPSITVAGTLIPENIVQHITLTVQNISSKIDTMAYNYLTIEAGYLKSGVKVQFSGMITNCYMAKPNPNGELVVNLTCANISNLYEQGSFAVGFLKDDMSTSELVEACLTAIIAAHPKMATAFDAAQLKASLPALWAEQKFAVGKATRHFNSALGCIAWLNSLFASYVKDTGYGRGAGGLVSIPSLTEGDKSSLGPLRLGFDTQGKIRYLATYDTAAPNGLKTLSCIGSAVWTSTDSATITAPFNPDIQPGDVVFIDSKYFKTRITIAAVHEDYAAMGNLWYVISNEFTFSTLTTNTMTLKLININSNVKASEG